jgi:hypothetical protein
MANSKEIVDDEAIGIFQGKVIVANERFIWPPACCAS